RGCMPSRGRKPFEQSFCSSHVVQMHRLRIKLSRETLDITFGDQHLVALEPHADRNVVEPFDFVIGSMHLARAGLREVFPCQYSAIHDNSQTVGIHAARLPRAISFCLSNSARRRASSSGLICEMLL